MLIACFEISEFALACERSRNPALWGEPCALATDDRVVCVVSDEARQFGVRAGQSGTGARSLCPRLRLLTYDTEAYLAAARMVWDAFAIESSLVEPEGPERCFVGLSGPDAVARAESLAMQLAVRLRVPVLLGIAASLLVAREAARCADGSRALVVSPGQETAFLAPVSVAELAEIDSKLCERLLRLGVRTLGDLLQLPAREVNRQFRQQGWRLLRLARGQDDRPLRPQWPPRQVEHAVTFEYEVDAASLLQQTIGLCAEMLAATLIAQRDYARSVTLLVGMNDDTWAQDGERLETPIHDADSLQRCGERLLYRLRIDRPVIHLCLQAGELGRGGDRQLALLDLQDLGEQGYPHERRQRLTTTLAYVRRRYGIGAVVPLALLHQARRIELWTHNLSRRANEPIQVAADHDSNPVRFYRHGQSYEIRAVQDRWREVDWCYGESTLKTVFRVETQPRGHYELHRIAGQWLLGAVAD